MGGKKKGPAPRRIYPLFLAVSAAYGCWNRAASAQYSWNTGSGTWSTTTGSDWSPSGGPPGSGATVNITNDDTTNRTISYDESNGGTFTLGTVTVNNYGGGTNTLSWASTYALQAANENIGDSGTNGETGQGAVIQSEGSNTITSGNLELGSYNDDTGTYSLSASGALSVVAGGAGEGEEIVGAGGTGTFNQSGGTNAVNSLIISDSTSGSSGTYSLGGGTLDFSFMSVGAGGFFNWTAGVFSGNVEVNQSGGTFEASGALELGFTEGNVGEYNLSGGVLEVGSLTVGSGGYAFNWTGGTLEVTNSGMTVGSGSVLGSSLTLNSGQTLDIFGSGQGLTVTGTMNLSGGNLTTGSLSVSGGAFNWTAGTLDLTTSALTVGSGGPLGSNLTLVSGQTLDTPSLSIASGGTMNLSGGSLDFGEMSLGAGGFFSWTSGEYFGNVEASQSGGTFEATGALELGNDEGNVGEYTLSGGVLEVGSLTVGTGGYVFNWTGGTLDLTNSSITVGSGSVLGSSLTLNSGQTLEITESGATLAITGTLNLSGGGLSAPTINQTAGTFTTTGALSLATTGGNTPTYKLSGGSANVGALYVGGNSSGPGGEGNLDVNGTGSLTATSITIYNTTGTEVLQTGGSVTAVSTTNNGTYDEQRGAANLGAISGTGSLTVGEVKVAGGTATMSGSALNQSSLTILATGSLKITSGSDNEVNSLSIEGGQLDITNTKLFIDYGSGADPIASIAAWIASGYADGAWNGPGIISSAIATADAASGLSYGIGYADGADGVVAGLPSGEIEIMFTLLGDANLDGTVNSEDFSRFSEHLGQSGMSWDGGDFNYDGTVNSEDFSPFSHNLGQTASLAAGAGDLEAANGISVANVPEPMSAGMMVMAGLGVLGRRRRSWRCRIRNS
jgi:hypothetical protein